MKIFFSGSLDGAWRSGWQRCQCLRDQGHELITFEQEPYISRALLNRTRRLLSGQFYDLTVLKQFNRDILAAIEAARPQVAWLEWPLLVTSETLQSAVKQVPGCSLVSFQDDNPFGSRANESRRWELFLQAIPHYDLHFVKRQTDASDYFARGAHAVHLFRHGFFRNMFHPLPRDQVSKGSCSEVSFVGTPLDHRTTAISQLLLHHQIPLRVYGGRWNRTVVYHRRHACFRPPIVGEDYVQVICGSRVSLGFVSSSNRDEYTMRTFEIPACKGFLLAERTPAHQELFVEGEEAEFFGSVAECADKIRFYLKAESQRDRIAESGYRRCMESDYSLHASMSKALTQIQSARA